MAKGQSSRTPARGDIVYDPSRKGKAQPNGTISRVFFEDQSCAITFDGDIVMMNFDNLRWTDKYGGTWWVQ